jgi:hypothetical protein
MGIHAVSICTTGHKMKSTIQKANAIENVRQRVTNHCEDRDCKASNRTVATVSGIHFSRTEQSRHGKQEEPAKKSRDQC